jgi:hypothetical protein
VGRADLDGPVETGERFNEIALGQVNKAEIVVSGSTARLALDRLLQRRNRPGCPIIQAQQLCQFDIPVGGLWAQWNSPLDQLDATARLTFVGGNRGEQLQAPEMVGLQLEDPLAWGFDIVELAGAISGDRFL